MSPSFEAARDAFRKELANTELLQSYQAPLESRQKQLADLGAATVCFSSLDRPGRR